MYPVELIIFDLDGTLVDSASDLISSVNFTLETLGLPEEDPKLIRSFIGDGVRKLIERSLGSEYPHLYLKAVEVFRFHYNEHLLDQTKLYQGTEEVLIHFSPKKKAVLTNKSYEFTVKILKGLKIFDYFDEIVGADSIPYLKPEPHGIINILENLKVKKEKAVIIGDSVRDIEAGKKAGIKCCAALYGYTSSSRLLELSPDFFCNNILEIKKLFI